MTDARGPAAAPGHVSGLRWPFGPLAVLLAALWALSLYSYPVFHTLAEMLCVVVASSVFVFVLYTRRLHDNHYMLFVGIGSLFFAILGGPHMFAYQGVALLPGFDNDLPTQAFIAQRFVLAVTFLIAPAFVARRVRFGPTMAAFGAVVIVLLLSLLVWRNFPHMWVEGSGLTPLKKAAELVLSVMFAGAGVLLWRRRAAFDQGVWRFLIGALACFSVSELMFTSYASPFGSSNLLAHLLQVAAFYLIYRAVLVTSLVKPFSVLFRELSESGRENERLLQVEQVRGRRMTALKEIAELGVASIETRQLAQGIADAMPEVLDADLAVVALPIAGGSELFPIGSVGWPDDYLDELSPAPAGSPLRTCYESGRTTLIEDTQADGVEPVFKERSHRYGARSIAVVPMLVAGEPIGALSVAWLEPHAFDADETSFLEAIAAEAAIALQNTRLFEAERAAREQARDELETTQLLLEAAKALAGNIEIHAVLATVSETVLRFAGPTRVFVNLIDMQHRVLQPVIASGGIVEPVGSWIPFDRLSSTSREAILAKRTALLDYERPETPPRDREIAASNDVRLVLFVPLVVADDVVGHIAIDEAGRRHAFSAREIELIESVAAQAAVVVRNARLYDAAQRHAVLDRALADAASSLAESLETQHAMPRVLELTSDALGGIGGILSVREADVWRVSVVHGMSPDLVDTVRTESEAPTLQRILETKRPQFVADVADATETVRAHAAANGYRAFISVPVLFRDRVVAALSVFFAEPREPMTDDELFIVSRIAFTVGLAEENARLYRREHTIAETLQEALLALPDRLPGIDFARLYRAATEASRVGGDFYDIFELGSDRIGITIGDVAGKGLGAAITTSLVKNTIRAHAAERGKAPGEILTLTHDVVYKATTSETFATVFFAILDCTDGRLTYASAGHTTSAVVRPDGTVERLGATGPLLGAFTGAEFGEAETLLGEGDMLFIYTDGLTEARRAVELYGEERLFDFLSSTAGAAPDEVVSRVMGEVMAFADNKLRDDLAILAIRRDPASGEAPRPA